MTREEKNTKNNQTNKNQIRNVIRRRLANKLRKQNTHIVLIRRRQQQRQQAQQEQQDQ